jgi:predicted DNA-binding transcriptional regulator AlpA
MAEALLTPAQAGELLGLSVPALAQMRYLGSGPKFLKLTARAVRYRRSDIDQWVESTARTSTSGAA